MEKHLKFLKNLPQYDQGTTQWLQQRKGKLTSSDIATALGINPYKKAVELLLEKCGAGRTFTGNENTEHGHKYESEAIGIYESLLLKENHTFGMISFADLDPIRETKESSRKYIDKKYHFLGGSPDGISVDKLITDESVLTQVEVKCPLRRKIKHGQIPEYYFPQVQLNMFILDLEVTDFIEYIPNIAGKSVEINIVRIFRDDDWFERIFPTLEKFWADVCYWRTQDITTHPDYDKYYGAHTVTVAVVAPQFLFIEDDSEERPSSPIGEDVCLFED
jgi:predicted phage-related endonuclease